MKANLMFWSVLLLVFGSVPVRAQEPPVLYDDFNNSLFDPAKWVGQEFGSDGREAVREIKNDAAHLAYRVYADTNSDAGSRVGLTRLIFLNPAAITAFQATLMVNEIGLVGSTSNPSPSSVRAALSGFFFNTGTPTPGSHENDVSAVINVIRFSNSMDPEGVLQVNASVFRCNDSSCSSQTQVDFSSLGTLSLGDVTKLGIVWDSAGHRFIFLMNGVNVFESNYNLPDTAPPGVNSKFIDITNNAVNSTTVPRPVAFMDIAFDDVFVNAPPEGGAGWRQKPEQAMTD